MYKTKNKREKREQDNVNYIRLQALCLARLIALDWVIEFESSIQLELDRVNFKS